MDVIARAFCALVCGGKTKTTAFAECVEERSAKRRKGPAAPSSALVARASAQAVKHSDPRKCSENDDSIPVTVAKNGTDQTLLFSDFTNYLSVHEAASQSPSCRGKKSVHFLPDEGIDASKIQAGEEVLREMKDGAAPGNLCMATSAALLPNPNPPSEQDIRLMEGTWGVKVQRGDFQSTGFFCFDPEGRAYAYLELDDEIVDSRGFHWRGEGFLTISGTIDSRPAHEGNIELDGGKLTNEIIGTRSLSITIDLETRASGEGCFGELSISIARRSCLFPDAAAYIVGEWDLFSYALQRSTGWLTFDGESQTASLMAVNGVEVGGWKYAVAGHSAHGHVTGAGDLKIRFAADGTLAVATLAEGKFEVWRSGNL